jgi:hypothetical protein
MISNAKKYEWKRRGSTYLELWFGGRLIVKVINGNECVVRAVTEWGASGSELYEKAKRIQIGEK